MKEQDYINVRDVGIVMAASTILNQLCGTTQPSINDEDLLKVRQLMSDWCDDLFLVINTDDDPEQERRDDDE